MIERRITGVSMEAAMFHRSPNQTQLYPYNSHTNNPKIINHPFISKPYVNFLPSNYHKTGILKSYPPHSLQQPPLLPNPPVNKRISLKKSKSPTKNLRKEGKKSPKKCSEFSTVSSATMYSNDCFSTNNLTSLNAVEKNKVEIFSGCVAFTTISPPPSSLPLPTFSLRPKLISCKTQAAGIDAGATDDLRRLLRIQ